MLSNHPNACVGLLVSLCAMSISEAGAAEPRVVPLWAEGAPGAVGKEDRDRPTLTIYEPAPEKATGTAIVVCPGGGYGGLAMGHEGHDVARWLSSIGITATILKYRHAPRYHFPAPLQDAQRAIRTVRARAEEWKIAPDRIGILGFSAGGHLASSAGTHFELGKPDAKDPVERVSSRPDFMVLAYPVISFTSAFTHVGSRNNFLGKNRSPEMMQKFSNETQVTKETPPTFLMHTSEDRGVPSENSIYFYLALRRAGVPAEMHIYEKGRHGVGLAPKDPVLSSWPKRCEGWMRKRGILSGRK